MKTSWIYLLLLIFNSFLSVIQGMTFKSESNGIFDISTNKLSDEEFLHETGRFILANMNQTIDPCENFYEFACGNWKNGTFFSTVQKQVNDIIVKFLNTTIDDDKEPKAETKAKKLFSSCVNMLTDLNQGYRTIFNSIKDPILKKDETLDWIFLNSYSENGLNPFLQLVIKHNLSSLQFEIFIKEPFPYLTSEFFNFTKIAENLKFDDKETVEKELEGLRSFEKKLIESLIDPTSANNSKSESLGDFLEAHNSSEFDWKRFFDLAFNGTTKDSWIINYEDKNFQNMNKFLSRTDTNIMFKYVQWSNVLEFYNTYSSADKDDLDGECLYITLKHFKNVIIPWFIEITFDEERRADALLLSKHLKETFYSMINRTTWLDSETKSAAKSKLRAMDLIYGYTDDMKHPSEIDDELKDIDITNDFWLNVLNIAKNSARTSFSKIGEAFIELAMPTNLVNAAYEPALNLVFMTIGISQFPFYHINLPNSLKFGGIGAVIGHEMAHAFDSTCYKYDYNGNKRNWWSEQSLRNFKERYQCLESQYNKFIYNGLKSNGKQTSGDDIADNVGLQIAYQSYLSFLDEDGNLEKSTDKPLPGVDFTNKQLFFINYAQEKCDGKSADVRMEIMSNDEHSNNEFRVVGPLQNMAEFSEEFQCPLGSNMNPFKKCVIYGNE